jgi:hypothetical protein
MTGPIRRIQYQQELLEFGRNRGIVNSLPKAETRVMHFPSPDRSGAAPTRKREGDEKRRRFAHSLRGRRKILFESAVTH